MSVFPLVNANTWFKNICSGRKPIASSTSSGGNASASRPPQVVMEDGIDPDNMTYEVNSFKPLFCQYFLYCFVRGRAIVNWSSTP